MNECKHLDFAFRLCLKLLRTLLKRAHLARLDVFCPYLSFSILLVKKEKKKKTCLLNPSIISSFCNFNLLCLLFSQPLWKKNETAIFLSGLITVCSYAGAIFADACLKGLNGVPDVVECSYVQSTVTDLPFFASKVIGLNLYTIC
jgi:hypothetical protein